MGAVGEGGSCDFLHSLTHSLIPILEPLLTERLLGARRCSGCWAAALDMLGKVPGPGHCAACGTTPRRGCWLFTLGEQGFVGPGSGGVTSKCRPLVLHFLVSKMGITVPASTYSRTSRQGPPGCLALGRARTYQQERARPTCPQAASGSQAQRPTSRYLVVITSEECRSGLRGGFQRSRSSR